MKVYIIREKTGIKAEGEFDINTGELVVKKNSVLSEQISKSEKFRGTDSILKKREGKVINRVLQEDVFFSSPSTAANFVTGSSTNGWVSWKDEKGNNIKEYKV